MVGLNANKSVEISQIYTSRKTILELLGSQEYNVSGYLAFTVNEVNAMEKNDQLDMLVSHPDGRKVYVRYYLKRAIRPKDLQEMIDDLFMLSETLTKRDTLYIIVRDSVNDTLYAELKTIWERDGIFIVIEHIKCLQYNILKHILVPPHRPVMDTEEVNNIMLRYNVKNMEEFADISRFDPVARAICLRPGQLCHILRNSKTAIQTNYYRVCLNV